jgi:DNA repair protein RadC
MQTHFDSFTDSFADSAAPLGMAVSEQPHARLDHYGPRAVSDGELIAVILQGHGIAPAKAVALAHRLLATAGTLAHLSTWPASRFQTIAGIGTAKALQLVAALEIGRRALRGDYSERPRLGAPSVSAAYLQPILHGLEVEKFLVLCLDRKNRLLRCVEMTSGTTNAAQAHSADVFRTVVRENASGFICAHNHPSGDPAPSAPDLHVTRVLRDGAKVVDLQFIDHIIIGRVADDPLCKGYFSFREAGIL